MTTNSTTADEKSMNEVYADRNVLVCGLVASHSDDLPGGWTVPDDTDGDEYVLAWLETPHGQASWHVPRDQAERLLDRNDAFDYDGHDRVEKNARVAEWVANQM